MKYFYDTYLNKKNYKKTYLLAHSMGGAIGMTYLEQYPNDFLAAAFSSPMLGFKPPGCTIVKVMDGDKPKYALGEAEYKDDLTTFKGNILTGYEIRYDRTGLTGDMSFAFITQNYFRGLLNSESPSLSTQAGLIWGDWIFGMYGGVGFDGTYQETDFLMPRSV